MLGGLQQLFGIAMAVKMGKKNPAVPMCTGFADELLVMALYVMYRT